MNQYICSQCKLAVIIVDGEEPIKACTCEAPIIGEMSGTATGSASMNV
jgi:hypothetical protein